MNKPTKKGFLVGKNTADKNWEISVCNKSCDDWEKFLPDTKEIEKIIFTLLYKRKLSNKYRYVCRCFDGCVNCDGTGFILDKLGLALINVAKMIAKRIGK